jgi:hypothetical protein
VKDAQSIVLFIVLLVVLLGMGIPLLVVSIRGLRSDENPDVRVVYEEPVTWRLGKLKAKDGFKLLLVFGVLLVAAAIRVIVRFFFNV